jgi:hypothetical protein
VTVERDVYFDEKAATEPGTASIEGEWDDDILESPEPSSTSKTLPTSDKAAGNEQNRGITDTVEPPVSENLRTSPPHEPNPAPANAPQPETSVDNEPAPPPTHVCKRKTEVERLGEPEPNMGRGRRTRKAPGFYHGLNAAAKLAEASTEDVAAMFQMLEEEEPDDPELDLEAEDEEDHTFVVEFAMVTESVPMSLRQAITGPDAKHWMPAAQAEFTQLEKLNTWDIVEAPMGANIIRNHYVLTIKRDAFNQINKYKVRLVADGRTQVYRIHYTDTYAPVVCHATLRVLLAFGAVND